MLKSESGVQQGDPLGPLLFCLTMQDITASPKSGLNVWYLDDGTIGGKLDTVLTDLHTIEQKGKDVGLSLNFAKCEVFFCNDGFDTINGRPSATQLNIPNIKYPSSAELSLLGSPLFSSGISSAIEQKTAEVKRLTDRLHFLPAHQAIFILKNCLSVPKILYLLRTAPTFHAAEKLQAFDSLIRSALSSVTNTPMEDRVWRQATFPVSRGGLGIRRTDELALPAYLASAHSVRSLVQKIVPAVDYDDVLADPISRWQQYGATLPLDADRSNQKSWDSPLLDLTCHNMVAELDPIAKARLLAASCNTSGSWLHAVPSPALGNLLDDNTLRVSVALRLGASVCHSHRCRCGETVSSSGHHGLSCRKSAGRHSRHSAVNEVIRRALVSASLPATLEPNGLERDNGKRPDGMTMVPWKQGKSLVWDVTCVHTLALTYIAGTTTNAGAAADEAEKKKERKYSFLDGRFLFSPLAFETMGPWGKKSKQTIHEIGKRIAAQTFEKRSLEFLRQRISTEIQRGNAASVLGTHPYERGLDEVYYVLSNKH